MLRKVRIVLAALFFIGMTLLFLDFTGTLHVWLGWMAKIQFLPALLAVNAGVVAVEILITLIFGRVYCSVICPLGVMQDIMAWFGKKSKKNRYSYSHEKKVLRYGILVLFVVALVAGIGLFVALLAPYSSYGRIAQNLFAPIYQAGNNLFAWFAERADSYSFYSTEVWIRSIPTFVIAVVVFVLLFVLAWRSGRTYCNTICPVGTVLGFISRFSWLKPVIDTDKCVNCKKCERNCKAACIDISNHTIDYGRCVACMDCIDKCHKGAIKYMHMPKSSRTGSKEKNLNKENDSKGAEKPDVSRRSFLSVTALAATAATLKAQEMKVDGGLAVIEDKKLPDRKTPIVPPGALSARNFAQHCTACQLCVSVCPNGVLRPSTDIMKLMQPEMGYDRGYCRPECNKCSEVCPAGAIRPITVADKSSTQIGHAVWVKENCVPLTDGVECGNCARHCPSGAITMIPSDPNNPASPKIPAVNEERCIGCGACEYLCPARPFSAIYVEGHKMHRTI